MARGRFISKKICADKTVQDLNDPWSMLAFTWLITHTDCEGRTYGDPAMVKSLVFPRRTDVTVEMIDGYLREWDKQGLIFWYEADGDMFIEFPNFEKNQPGLNKDREAPSTIPSRSGVTREQNTVKLSKVKISEVKGAPEPNDDPKTHPGSHFSAIFVEETHIPELTGGVLRWSDAVQKLIKAGVTEDDLRTGIHAMQDKNYSIVGLQSVVNPAIVAMQNRLKQRGREGPIKKHVTPQGEVIE